MKFKERQGRICSVMCWGLQRFAGALHNRKLGTHCLQGLKQQACPVRPPPWPCDNDGDMWPIIDKRQGSGGAGFFFLREGMPAFLDPVHLCSRATSAEVVMGLLFPSRPNYRQYPWIRAAQQNVKCSANPYPKPVMRYQLIVTNIDQSATCRPRKLKGGPWPSDQSRCSYEHVRAFTCITPLNFSQSHTWFI